MDAITHVGIVSAPADPRRAALLVHGGAWAIPDSEVPAHREGLARALDHGRALLQQGADALTTVTETVASLEADGAFDAGRGAVLTRSGTVELDAGVMDGDTLGFGAVGAVRRVAHPIRLARCVLEEGRGEVRFLVGEGAEAFAAGQGIALVENGDLVCPRERRRFQALQAHARSFHTSHPFLPPSESAPSGTVGCVARDRAGRLAAATSTGGTPFRLSGRIGDSPLPGCGYYATSTAAASATGWGEAIATVLLTGRIVDAVAAGTAVEAAVRRGLRHMHEAVRNRDGQGATGGLILIGPSGRGAWAYTTPRMARGGWTEGDSPWVDV